MSAAHSPLIPGAVHEQGKPKVLHSGRGGKEQDEPRFPPLPLPSVGGIPLPSNSGMRAIHGAVDADELCVWGVESAGHELRGSFGGSIGDGDDYPNRPIRIIVAYTLQARPTSSLARSARMTGAGASGDRENRPGANGNIGTEIAAPPTPDGYPILMALPRRTEAHNTPIPSSRGTRSAISNRSASSRCANLSS